MVTLTEFLLARIAEDERAAERAVQWRTINGFAWMGPTPEEATALCISGHRLLAECEAKRRIVEWRDYEAPSGEYQPRGWREYVLRALALPYAEHPDYDPDFRP